MARCLHAFLSLLLVFVVTSALVQTSYCSRPTPPHVALADVADELPLLGGETELARRPAEEDTAGSTSAGRGGENAAGGRGGAVPSSTSTASAMTAAGGRGRSGDALMQPGSGELVALVLVKLARRFLAGDGTDAAAGPSCHSNNVHIGCSPPSPH